MMLLIDADGNVIATSDDLIHYDPREQAWRVGNTLYVDTGKSMRVARPLGEAKADLIDRINAKRDQLETEGFQYIGKPIDSDSRSVQRINTTVQAAQAAASAGQPFEIEWTCADDTTLTLDATGMIGMPVALAMHANALHQHARNLKTLVDAAETSADLESININAGWPV